MREKKNDLWKLDLLETKFTKTTPRFPFTKKLLNARNNTHVMKKLPRSPADAFGQIHALKSDLFAKKYHGSSKKLGRAVGRHVKQNQRTWGKEQEPLTKFFAKQEHIDELIKAKLIKLAMTAILTKENRSNPPTYILEEVRNVMMDKTIPGNPSHFFIKYCQNDKVLNGYVSKMWNSKEIKQLCSEIEWSFKKIRGNLTQAEKAAHATATGKKSIKDVDNEAESEDSESDDGDDSDDEGEAKLGMDAEEAFDKFADYDHLVAGSDAESDFVADLNVNYNEITDEEASDSDSDDEPPAKKAKTALPTLATGYFSGGSDDEDDVDNDKVVKEATTTRKNRRGQRARQKIWEQKYGSKAKHVQKEQQRVASEREQRQMEYEERQRKRELKAKLARESAPKYYSGPERTTAASSTAAPGAVPEKVHPSWEAKKQAEEKLKNVKFSGKKITFD